MYFSVLVTASLSHPCLYFLEPLMGLHSKGRLPAFLENIRPGWKWQTMTNARTYGSAVFNDRRKKSLVVQAAGVFVPSERFLPSLTLIGCLTGATGKVFA